MGTATAKAVFDADDSKMSAVMERMEKKLEKLEKGFGGFSEMAHKALELTGAAYLLEKGFEGFFQVLEKGEHLHNLSNITGAAVGDLYVLEGMFKSVGGSAEDAGDLIGHMQKTLADGSGNNVLDLLGLDSETLRKSSAPEEFLTIGEAIAKVPNAADRAAASVALLGKKGREALAIFADGKARDVFENARFNADIYDRSASTFGEVATKLGNIPGKLNTSWLILADRIADTLIPLLDQINEAIDGFNRGGTVQAAGNVGAYVMDQFNRPDGDAVASIYGVMMSGLDNLVGELANTLSLGLLDNTLDQETVEFADKVNAWAEARDAERAKKHHGPHDSGDSLLDFSASAQAGVTALGRVGGNWGGGGGDPWLDEARNHGRLLERIEENTRHGQGVHGPKTAAGNVYEH